MSLEIGDQFHWVGDRYRIDASLDRRKNLGNERLVAIRVYRATFALARESLEVEGKQEEYSGPIAI